MEKLVIRGGKSLFGTVEISGSKNAALPVLFATLITHGVSTIHRVPDIGDVRVAISILEHLGAAVKRTGSTLTVDTRNLSYRPLPPKLLSSIRASTYLIGAGLSRFGICHIYTPGGCNFCQRPIDLHLNLAESMGAQILDGVLYCTSLRAATVTFPKKSVGATANALIMAASASGTTVIRGHAIEPHVLALSDFLISAGADIDINEKRIIIRGRELHGGSCTLVGDMIEAGSYLAAGAISGGKVTVIGCPPPHLYSFLNGLISIGAAVDISEDHVTVSAPSMPQYASVVAAPYPDFATDLQPIIAPLMATGDGGEIRDSVWRYRFGYLDTLCAYGLEYRVISDLATIYPSRLHSATVTAPDLRGGMAAVLCALFASGESVILRGDILERGYERLPEKLRSIGADVDSE